MTRIMFLPTPNGDEGEEARRGTGARVRLVQTSRRLHQGKIQLYDELRLQFQPLGQPVEDVEYHQADEDDPVFRGRPNFVIPDRG